MEDLNSCIWYQEKNFDNNGLKNNRHGMKTMTVVFHGMKKKTIFLSGCLILGLGPNVLNFLLLFEPEKVLNIFLKM